MEILSTKLMSPTREGSEIAENQNWGASFGKRIKPTAIVARKVAPKAAMPFQSRRTSRIRPKTSGVSFKPPAIPTSTPRGTRVAGRTKSARISAIMSGLICMRSKVRRHGPHSITTMVKAAIVPVRPRRPCRGNARPEVWA